jgi:uncharacterized repeat protein (TIGR01451 family)
MRLRKISGAMAGVLALTALIVLSPPSANAASQAITSTGPLTKIEISPDLNCNVQHRVDPLPEFFGGTACGTLVALGPSTATSTLYGPADIPAGENASPRTPFTPVSQSGVSGGGTQANPYSITTVVALGDSGVQLTETDSYVTGSDSYRTDVMVENTTTNEVRAIVYRAADCFLQGSDVGYGKAASDGSIACVTSLSAGARTEQWTPLGGGNASRYYEGGFQSVWTAIGSRNEFPSTCDCATKQDNGAGLSWTLNLLATETRTVSHKTTLSPGPPQVVKTADKEGTPPSPVQPKAPATPLPLVTDGYTISLINPTGTPIAAATITDDLPAGFSYVPNSTTGATTTEPVISNNGSRLTWKEPKGKAYTVPAFSNISLHFNVYVPAAPTCGTFYNNASASGNTTMLPTGPTAPITVFCQAKLVAEPAIIEINNPPSVNLFTLKAHLTDLNTKSPLPGRTIFFDAAPPSGAVQICSAVTDDTGTATCNSIADLQNNVSILLNLGYDAHFKGDGAYAPLDAHAPAIDIGGGALAIK